MPAVDRIEIDIVALDQASPALAKARESMQQFGSSGAGGVSANLRQGAAAAAESESAFSKFGSTILEVGKVAAGFALGAGVFTAGTDIAEHFGEAVTQTEALGAATFQLQSRIGGTAENASALIAVFGRFGVDADTAQRSLVLFEKNLEAASASKSGLAGTTAFDRVFAQLGISAQDASGQMRPLNDVLVDIIDRIHSGLVPAEQIGADAQILFGRAGQQLAPILANLSGQEFVQLEEEARRLGLTLSQDNVDSLRQLSLANKDTEEAMAGLNIQFGLLISPFLTDAAKGAAAFAKEMNEGVKPAILAAASALENFINTGKLPAPQPQPGQNASHLDLNALHAQAESQKDPGQIIQDFFSSLPDALSKAAGIGLGAVTTEGNPPRAPQNANKLDLAQLKLDAQAQKEAESAALDTGTLHQHTANAMAAADATANAKAAQDAFDATVKAGGIDQQIIQEQINVAKRDSISLSTQIAAEDLNQIPLKERQLELQQQLLEAGNNIRQMEQQANVERAQQNAAPAANALEDAQFRQQELQARMKASALSGQGVNPADINALVENAKNLPAQQLAALEANRGVTLAQRDETASNRAADLATLPIREEQAQLAIVEGQQNMKIQMLRDEQQAQKDRAEIAVAGLQAELVAIEDINFQLKLKQDLEKGNINVSTNSGAGAPASGGGAPQVSIQFGDVSISNQMDLDSVKNQLQDAILEGLNKALQSTPNAASQSQSGARSQMPVGASGA